MLARHIAGILTAAGVVETIADRVDRYVVLAVHLGRDVELRSQIRLSCDAARVSDDAEAVSFPRFDSAGQDGR